MKDIVDKIDNNTTAQGRLPAAEYNDRNNELEKAVTSSGQTLTVAAGDSNVQLSQALAIYAAVANSYSDSGAVDALVAVKPTGFEGPIALIDRMQITIVPTANGTAGGATLDFLGIATDAIVTVADADPAVGDIQAGIPLDLFFDQSKQAGGGGWVMTNLQVSGALLTANNLSELTPTASTARSNLGLGSAAEQADTFFLQVLNNLSDLNDDATARTNLGLGSAAVEDVGEFLSLSLISGLIVSNSGGDTNHDITVAPGKIVDTTQARTINLTSAFTKRIDATWVVGSGNGGLGNSLTVANNTWYGVFLMMTAAGVVDFGFDTAADAANLLVSAPTYTFKRRIGYVLTDGTADIINWVQGGVREYVWRTPVNNLTIISDVTVAAATNVVVTAPPRQIASVAIRMNTTAPIFLGNILWMGQVDQDNFVVTSSNGVLVTASNLSPIITTANLSLQIRTNSTSQVKHRATIAGDPLNLNTLSWIDDLQTRIGN